MTDTTASDALIARIRKILAKTEQANCTPAEAEAAFAFASRLMTEHNLSMEEVNGAGAGEADWVHEEMGAVAKWTAEQQLALKIVENFFFVKSIFWHPRFDPETGKTVKPLRFFGRKDNVEVARYTFSALMASFWTLFEDYRTTHHVPASERRIFVAGVAKGFRDKLSDERKAQEAERDILSGRDRGTALVLASIQQKTVEKFQETFTNLRHFRHNHTPAKGSQSSFDAGYERGRKLNLHRQVGGKNQGKIGR